MGFEFSPSSCFMLDCLTVRNIYPYKWPQNVSINLPTQAHHVADASTKALKPLGELLLLPTGCSLSCHISNTPCRATVLIGKRDVFGSGSPPYFKHLEQ